MNVVLFGYRACGKTTVGQALAARLRYTFLDTDQRTCERLGNRSIAQVWEELGEPVWRETECDMTAEVLEGDRQVIALGGGTLMQPRAREAVERAVAARVYLKCEPAELLRRIRSDPASAATRPNLTGLGGGREEIERMLQEREPVYEAVADTVIDATREPPEKVVERIRASLLPE